MSLKRGARFRFWLGCERACELPLYYTLLCAQSIAKAVDNILLFMRHAYTIGVMRVNTYVAPANEKEAKKLLKKRGAWGEFVNDALFTRTIVHINRETIKHLPGGVFDMKARQKAPVKPNRKDKN